MPNIDVAMESTLQEVKNSLGASMSGVNADDSTTNLLATLISSPVYYSYNNGVKRLYFYCPFAGIIKIEARLHITTNRGSSSGSLAVCSMDGNTIVSDSKEFDSVKGESGYNDKTSHVLLPVKEGSSLRFTFIGARYDTTSIESIKVYGIKQSPGFSLLKITENETTT